MTNTIYRDRIEQKLRAGFSPILLEIRDESARHAGHAGARPEGETHFTVKIVSEAFDNKSRVERHRLIYAALAQEIEERVHALKIEATAKGEYNPN